MMAQQIIIEPLTPDELADLRRLESVVTESFYRMADALQEIKMRNLWRQYGTWEEYCKTTFNFGSSRARQIIGGAVFGRWLEAETGVILTTETVARELKRTGDDAVQIALAAQNDGFLSVSDLRNYQAQQTTTPTVTQVTPIPELSHDEIIRRQVINSRCRPIIDWMNEKRLTPDVALALWDSYSAYPDVMPLLKYQVIDPAIVRLVYSKRHTDGYQELVTTGYVQMGDGTAVELRCASLPQIRAYFDERSKEHQQRAMVERDAAKGVQEVMLILRLNDPAWSSSRLISQMGERNAREIARQVLTSTGIASHAAVYATF